MCRKCIGNVSKMCRKCVGNVSEMWGGDRLITGGDGYVPTFDSNRARRLSEYHRVSPNSAQQIPADAALLQDFWPEFSAERDQDRWKWFL